MVRFNGVNHLAMATGDMDKTIRFWKDSLGMRLAAGLGRPGCRHYFFELSDTDLMASFDGQVLSLCQKKTMEDLFEDPLLSITFHLT